MMMLLFSFFMPPSPPPPPPFFVCLLELEHVITRRDSCLLCGYCAFLTFGVTGPGDSCHVLLKGGDIVIWRGDDYDVLLKGGETIYHVLLCAGETIMCCFSEGRQLSCVVTWRGDNCHVLLHGGETVVMCCCREGRQLSCVVTGKGDNNCSLGLHWRETIVMLHGRQFLCLFPWGETTVMCLQGEMIVMWCYMEGRQLSCVVRWWGTLVCHLFLHPCEGRRACVTWKGELSTMCC